MKKPVDNFKLERISSRMAKDFGTIHKGEEDMYSFMLHPMEGNLLKLHRKSPKRNGRHAIDAIHMCLLIIDGYIRKIEYDFTKFTNAQNKAFLDGLLASFDPFTNQELFDAANTAYDLDSCPDLRALFENPVKCLLRIEKSIELWTKELGVNGYFNFIENHIGYIVENDDKMDFSMMLRGEDCEKMGIDVSRLNKFFPENNVK